MKGIEMALMRKKWKEKKKRKKTKKANKESDYIM
jgi:hypothetical protein